jgi:hypothetical protein
MVVWSPPGGDGMICMILFFWYTATSGGDYRKVLWLGCPGGRVTVN